MSINLDGFAVLRAIGSNPKLFEALRGEVKKTATALVVKSLTDKSADLEKVREVHGAVGAQDFELIADGMKDAQVKSLLTRLDRNRAEIKTSSASWRREHFYALLNGSQEVAPAAVKKTSAKSKSAKSEPKTKAPPKEEAGILGFKSAGKKPKQKAK